MNSRRERHQQSSAPINPSPEWSRYGTSEEHLMDMDGVLITGTNIVPGADKFIARLKERGAKYLVVTNNPRYTPGDLAHRLQWIGLDVPPELIFTSALATARFLNAQRPRSTAFVIGESGLTDAIHDVGYIITDHDPEYVVLGETNSPEKGATD